MTEEHPIDSADAMRAFGKQFAARLRSCDVVLLHGDLGAGKTTFTQGVAAALGVTDPVQSPTFTIVREHDGSAMRLYHLDLYRLHDADELEDIGYEAYIDPPDGIALIEWPERAADWLPALFWLVRIEHLGGDNRLVSIEHFGDVTS